MSSENVPCIAVALHKQHTISEKMMLSGRVLVTMWLSGWIIIIIFIILVTDINKVSVFCLEMWVLIMEERKYDFYALASLTLFRWIRHSWYVGRDGRAPKSRESIMLWKSGVQSHGLPNAQK